MSGHSSLAVDALRAVALRPWAVAFLVAGVIAVLYGPVVDSPFVFDDYHSVVKNSHIRDLGNTADFFLTKRAFSMHQDVGLYRPLLLTSYAFSYAVTGPDPWSFRLVNLFLHAVNGLLVFLLLRRLDPGAEDFSVAALVGAGLFTLHPGQTQAVMYISSRSEILAATFVFLSLLLFLHSRGADGSRGWRFWLNWAGALAAFECALLTKASGAMLLPAVVLTGLAMPAALTSKALIRLGMSLLPFLAVYAGHLRLKAVVSGGSTSLLGLASGSVAAMSFENLLLQLQAFGAYVRIAVFPYPLSIFHQLPEEGPVAALAAVVSLASLVALCGGAVFALVRGRRLLALGLAWFPAMLLPYFLIALYLTVNEHRLYLALFGLAVVAADLFGRSLNRRGPRLMLAVVVILCLTGTGMRNAQWNNPEKFWLNEVAAAPDHAWPYENLGFYYKRAGRYEDADEAFRQARSRKWAHLQAIHNYFGNRLFQAGRLQEAMAEFEKAMAYDPRAPDYPANIGSVLGAQGRHEEAVQYFERALSLSPCYEGALLNLAVAYWHLGRPDEAERTLRDAVACDEHNAAAHSELGKVLLDRDKHAEAVVHFERAAALGSDDAAFLYYVARARAREGRPQEALGVLRRAVALDPRLRVQARQERDFVPLRGLEGFRELVGEAVPPG